MYPTRTKSPLPLWAARKLARFASGSLQTACADIDAWFKGEPIGDARWGVIDRVLYKYAGNSMYALTDGSDPPVQYTLRPSWVDRKVAIAYYLYSSRQKMEAELLRSYIDGPPVSQPASNQASMGNTTAASIAVQQHMQQAIDRKLDEMHKRVTSAIFGPHPGTVAPPSMHPISAEKYWGAIQNAKNTGLSYDEIAKMLRQNPASLLRGTEDKA